MKAKVNQSDEHVLAEWLRELPPLAASLAAPRPQGAGAWQWTTGAPYFQNGRLVLPAPRWIDGRREHNLQVTVLVCTPCNNEWMSRLETEVKPFLSELVVGDTSNIRWSERAPLARWATKTAFAYERDDPDSAAATSEQLADLRVGAVPRDSAVWVSRWSEPTDVLLRHSLVQAFIKGTTELFGLGSRTFIGLGDIVILVAASSIPWFSPLQLAPGPGWEQLWPPRATDVHLPTGRQTRADIEAIDAPGGQPSPVPEKPETPATSPLRLLTADSLAQLATAQALLQEWDHSGSVTFEHRVSPFSGRQQLVTDSIVPPPAAAIAAIRDAATYMREALDLTYQALLAAVSVAVEDSGFPFARDAEHWEDLARVASQLPAEAFDAIRLAQPHLSSTPDAHPLAFTWRASEYPDDSGLVCLRGGATMITRPDGDIDAYDYSDVLDGFTQRPEIRIGTDVITLLPAHIVDPWRSSLDLGNVAQSQITIVPRFGVALGPTHDLFPDIRDALEWVTSNVLRHLWRVLDSVIPAPPETETDPLPNPKA